MNEPGNQSFIGDLCPLVSDAAGTDAIWGVNAADKPDLYGVNNVIGRSMVVYEKGDDFGNDPDNSFASTVWGSGCEKIACCNIKSYKVINPKDPN